jgi:hypothetical protein
MDLLAPVEDLQAWLQDPGLDPATAAVALAAASGVVRGRTGQDFTAVVADTVVLDGMEDQWLTLPQRPVTAVTAVAINGVTQGALSWWLSGSRLYRWRGWNRALVSSASTAFGLAPTLITVTYDHGYDEIPDDVKGAVLAIAADIVTNPAGLVSENIDDYTWRRSESPAGTAAGVLLAAVVRRYGTRVRTVRLR